MTEAEALKLMKHPGAIRHGIWRGGVLQVKVTNACDLDCRNCTAAVGLAKKHRRVWFMGPDLFREALRSLKGYHGVVGMFGGNPTLNPHFEELCAIFREEFPDQQQRGLWCNNLRGKGRICRETFSPIHSNLNVHRNAEAYNEIRRTWPEAHILRDGLLKPSMHGSWWVAMRDVIPDEGERWDLISRCFVNQTWSAEITLINGQLRAYFCEWAATMDEYADLEGREPCGIPVTPGWWQQPMTVFADQVRQSCHNCGAPLNPHKIEDLGQEPEDFSATHQNVFLTIKGRPHRLVTTREQGETPATQYLPTVMPAGYREGKVLA